MLWLSPQETFLLLFNEMGKFLDNFCSVSLNQGNPISLLDSWLR